MTEDINRAQNTVYENTQSRAPAKITLLDFEKVAQKMTGQ